MKLSEVLRSARAKIEKAENWTQGEIARDTRGRCNPKSPNAECWCAVGSIDVVTGYDVDDYGDSLEILETLAGMALDHFNDTHTHAEVLSLFDRAIAAAEARGE